MSMRERITAAFRRQHPWAVTVHHATGETQLLSGSARTANKANVAARRAAILAAGTRDHLDEHTTRQLAGIRFAQERVTAGAAYLDRHDPDWLNLVNVDELEASDPSSGVLAQLELAYGLVNDPELADADAMDRRCLDTDAVIALGMYPACDEGGPLWRREWDVLDAAWRQLITWRRLAEVRS